MIDISLLPADGYGTPIDEDDNELFVSQDDLPLQNEGTGLFQDQSETAALFTSNKPFGLFQPPAASVGAVQTNPFANIPASDAPAKPLFASNSLFSASAQTSAPAPSWSPFSQTPASTSAPSQGTIAANAPQTPFSWQPSTQSSPIQPATAPVEPPKPTFSWASSSQPSSNLFKTPEISTPTEEPKPQPSLPTPSITPSLFPAQKSKPEVPPSSKAAETSKPLFSWPPNPQVSSPAFKAPDFLTTTVNEAKPSSPFSFQPSNVNVSTPSASDAASKSIFSKPPLAQTSPATFGTPAPIASNGLFSLQTEQVTPPVQTEDRLSSESQIISQPSHSPASSANLIPNASRELTSVESVAELQQDQPPVDGSLADSLLSGTEPFSRSESSVDESADFRKSWIESLRQSAIENRTSKVNRKRPLEAEKEEVSQTYEKKIAPTAKPKVRREKVAKSKQKPVPRKLKKTSLALASIAPLPTLPILERVKELTQVKRPTEDETAPSRASQIDEDEMLLSAARIAAEQLKSGPRLLDRVPDYSYIDPLRSSTYFGRSLNSESRVLSSSVSSLSSPHARINGYDLALAPETPLGLGRTLSRTEQRLRLTGGRGLAYKPLQLTPEKETLTKKSGKKKFSFSSES
jgi:nuclear mRNA export protein SAC3